MPGLLEGSELAEEAPRLDLYIDPIHQFTTFDEEEDDPKVEPAAPDFDL